MKCFFTTSWDDGSIHDLKLAELLARYSIKGTFYIPIKNLERNDSLEPEQIKLISELFEIGGHTYSHMVLSDVDYYTAKREIEEGKKALEDIISKSVVTFCPPRGKFKKKHLELIQYAGFKLVRTVGYLRTRNIVESYNNMSLLHTTFQFYPHKPLTYIISALKRNDREGFIHIWKNISNLTWHKFLRNIFREVESSGGVFHLWGHSWELEEYNLWNELEDFLKYMRDYENIQTLTNYEVYKEYACR